MTDPDDGLGSFLPPVADWFRRTFGEPTPPQRQGWPAIAAGRNTLIFAPTGSGKTLAAFLAALDHLWRVPPTTPGVRILYISPLKALNEDVARNLSAPLEGILAAASAAGTPLERLAVGVRSGDTPTAERQRLARKPPSILITTPESLHLILTSRARETLRSVSHVVVDEIHALAPNKRGVFLALLLERLEEISTSGFVRIGLSATQRPLEEVALYLGGLRKVASKGKKARFEPRPVTIVDAGRRKDMDLGVELPGRGVGPPSAGSIWPAIESRLDELIRSHRSTIVFANNRRVVERLTSRLNERAEAFDPEAPPIARSHHGSLSLEQRRQTETLLKDGELPAVVATASLELGIDMGAVDLVCQVESPGGIARGLQRVGRAGHLVGRTSKGRLLAKTAGDLLETAALARAMLAGRVEALRVPTNCLDVLAQQVIAIAAMDRVDVPTLFDLVRRSYPYRDLTADAFEGVLRLVSGRFHHEAFRDLRPRVSWDRAANTLNALPGSKQLATVGGGTIPDTGQYPLYLGADGPRLGELDEEFVLERRVGETFVLGTSTWRIEAIEASRVVVAPAAGRSALMPFWRGEAATRTAELGEAVGRLCREVVERGDGPGAVQVLEDECKLDHPSAQALLSYIGRQMRQAGAVPDDRTILVETFRDPAGELGLAVLTPFGGKLHHALKLAIQGKLRRRLGIDVACLHGDDGVLVRIPDMDEPPTDLLSGLTADLAAELVRAELADSALFGLRFRQNAGRALLLPRPDPGKRTPLWLQRLRAKDLLQGVRQFADFPIVVETYRECLNDDLDIPRLKALLNSVADGSTRVVERRGEIPSPFASELIFKFMQTYLYEWDNPRRADPNRRPTEVDADLLDPLLDPSTAALWLDPDAVARVSTRLRGVGRPPRTVDEMAEWLRSAGDLADQEIEGPMRVFLDELEVGGRAARVELIGTEGPGRWIDAEDANLYETAFASKPDEAAQARIIARYLRTRALVGLDELTARYPIDVARAGELLESLDGGQVVRVDGETPRWADKRNLREVQRLSIALKRRESVAVAPEVFCDFVARRQHAHPDTRVEGTTGLEQVLEALEGYSATADLWEHDVLTRRLREYRPARLDELLATGRWAWRGLTDGRGEIRVAIHRRDFAGIWPVAEGEPVADASAVAAYLHKKGASFVDSIAAGMGRPPSAVRASLLAAAGRGEATNDRFDPLREGGDTTSAAIARGVGTSPRGRPRLGSYRRPATDRPEGRWSAVGRQEPVPEEAAALGWAAAMLDRYGVLARETAAMEPWSPPWRDLIPHLARAELRGELRRGYFVEGLSGVQYATAEAAEALAKHAARPMDPTPYMLSTLDPANLYGSGAPLDIPLLEGGTARLPRSSAHSLILVAGRPVLIVEAHGKRLTGLGSASEAELRAAIALLPGLAGPARRVLKVETYNTAATLASPAAPWLAEVGFVRDPPGMAYYAGW